MSPPATRPRAARPRPGAAGGGLRESRLTAGRRRAAGRAARGRRPRPGRARARSRRRRRSRDRGRRGPARPRTPGRTRAGAGPSRAARPAGRRLQVAQVAPVGGEDQVVVGEVRGRDLARRAVQRDAARPRRRGRARVGRVADVPVAGPRAVDLDRVLEPLLAQQRAHHALGGRGAADVAQADEEQADHGADRMAQAACQPLTWRARPPTMRGHEAPDPAADRRPDGGRRRVRGARRRRHTARPRREGQARQRAALGREDRDADRLADADLQDPLGPRHDVPHRRQAALLHGGRRAGELPRAPLEARREEAAVAADPRPAAAQRLQGLGARARAADARAHDVARDRQGRAEGAAVRRRARGWTASIGIGGAATPTPSGRYWIRERLPNLGGNAAYGPLAFGTPRTRACRSGRRRRDRHPRHERAGPDPRAPVARLHPRRNDKICRWTAMPVGTPSGSTTSDG